MTAMRKVLLAGVAVCAAALVGMSAAWACTPGGSIKAEPGSGLAGSPVQVSGTGFLAPSSEAGSEVGPVEIRWNSTSGRLLGTANDVSFSTSVTVPEGSASRRYYFVAVQRRGDGSIVRNGAAPFIVTSPATETAPAPPPASEPRAEEAPAPSSSDEAAAPQAESAPAAATAPDPNTAASSPARRRATTDAGVVRSARPGAAVAAAPPTDPGEPATVAAEPPPPPATPEVSTDVSPRSVTGDVWAAWSSSAAADPGPSLMAPSAPTQSTGMGAGIGLLALGTATLLAAAFVGLRPRRRALNAPPS